MRRPQVSVVVPVFNRARYIEQCVRSALEQTMADLEVIVVDNASTDGTIEVLRRLERDDDRVRVFRNEHNIGPVRNWLRCLDEVRAPLTKLLFSDDWIDRTFLEATAPALQSSPDVALAYTAAAIHREDEADPAEICYRGVAGRVPSGTVFRGFLGLDGRRNFPVSPGCALLRTACCAALAEAGAIPTRTSALEHGVGPDLWLLARAAQSAAFVHHDPRPLAHFRAHSGSLTTGRPSRQTWARYATARLALAQRHADPVLSWEVLAAQTPRYFRERMAGDPVGYCVAHAELSRVLLARGPRALPESLPGLFRQAALQTGARLQRLFGRRGHSR